MKNTDKGFTLVEVIVALTILAIMSAVLIPSLSVYLKKAKGQEAIAECRLAVNAAQTLYSEDYMRKGIDKESIKGLAQVSGDISAIEEMNNTLIHLTYTNSSGTTVYCRNWEDCTLHDEIYTVSDKTTEVKNHVNR